MPKLSQIFGGRKAKNKKLDLLTPEQKELQKLMSEGLKSGQGPFADLFGEFNMEDFEKGVSGPAMEKFKNEILPQIQEKFIAGNAALGSGMQRAQVKGAADLQSQLAQLMYQAQQQQKQNRIQGIQQVQGTREFENLYQPRQVGAGEAFLQGIAKEAPGAIANYATGGASGMAKALNSTSDAFKGAQAVVG
jgi:hypothetical protein